MSKKKHKKYNEENAAADMTRISTYTDRAGRTIDVSKVEAAFNQDNELPYKQGLSLTMTVNGSFEQSFFLFIINGKLQFTEQIVGSQVITDALIGFFELSEKPDFYRKLDSSVSREVLLAKATFGEYCLTNPKLAPIAAKYAFLYPSDHDQEKLLLTFDVYKNIFNAKHTSNYILYDVLIKIINEHKIFLDFSKDINGELSADAEAVLSYCKYKVEDYKEFLGAITEEQVYYLHSQYNRDGDDYIDLSGNQYGYKF